ncbi:MAG: glucosaminidase domain-containing protein, partial [Candidatus Aenigmarchaeota archaeon]|nr:glucosaminidase domain-containing protein [Candidatus Aenigmarchaeota archaeon]
MAATLAYRQKIFLDDARSIGLTKNSFNDDELNFWTYAYYVNPCFGKANLKPEGTKTKCEGKEYTSVGRQKFFSKWTGPPPSTLSLRYIALEVTSTWKFIADTGVFGDEVSTGSLEPTSCPLDADFLSEDLASGTGGIATGAFIATGMQIAGSEQPIRTSTPSVTTAQIQAFLENKAPGSKLTQAAAGKTPAQIFYDEGVRTGIDPRFAVAVALHESANGDSAKAKQCNNLFGTKKSDGVACSVNSKWRSYTSVEEAIKHFYSLMAGERYRSATTVEAVAATGYCGNRDSWIARVRALMGEMKPVGAVNTDLAGDSATLSILDVSSMKAEFVSACKRNADGTDFLCDEKNQNYYAAISLPTEGVREDYQKCVAGGQASSYLSYMPNMQPKINDPSNPTVGNFYIENGVLKVTTDNLPKDQILFQLNILNSKTLLGPRKIKFSSRGDMLVLTDDSVFIKKTGLANFEKIETTSAKNIFSTPAGIVFVHDSDSIYRMKPDYSLEKISTSPAYIVNGFASSGSDSYFLGAIELFRLNSAGWAALSLPTANAYSAIEADSRGT